MNQEETPSSVTPMLLSFLAGAANTPIAASIMAIELFGPGIAPHAAIACIVAFLMSGHRSVYPSQVLSMLKSPSVSATTGKAINLVEHGDVTAQFKLPGWLARVFRR